MSRFSKVRAIIKPDPKSPLFGKRMYYFKVVTTGADWSVTAIVRDFNLASAERRFRKYNKRFRHEVRINGGSADSYEINIARVNKKDIY
jgi:hypothetical protein